MKVLRKPSNLYKVAMTVCVIFLAFICYIFAEQMQNINQSANAIAEGNEIQFELENIITAVNTNEIALKNYLLTSNENYLNERALITSQLYIYTGRYRKLIEDTPQSLKFVDSLENLLSRRRKMGDDIVQLHTQTNIDTGKVNLKLMGRNNLTALINSYIKTLSNEQNLEVKHNNERHRSEIANMSLNAIILTLVILAILFFAFKKFYDDVIVLGKVNDELKLLNYAFEIAEKTAGFGYWKYNISQEKMIFSQNFYKIMGHSPEAVPADIESATIHVHPDDREMVIKKHRTSLIDSTPTDFVFRILMLNGDVRYVNSVGSYTKNSAGDHLKVGAVFDITKSFIASKKLEKSNKKLRAINSELESFNHIASHDLQEPLRKIQMFISRIEGTEDPDAILSYHGKIKNTAQRMQQLLTDLLQYSRMVTVDNSLEIVNLNDATNVAVDELSERIAEKSAILQIGNLPQVRAIRFQMERLFVNLLGNAIKYSKDRCDPIVSIRKVSLESDKIDDREISGNDYHKIEVRDNGIGFLPEYAERMFILFKRLDNNTKYSGTGVGLAICKKIMENHNGFITADGAEGKGATFYLYFPKPKK